jgi:Tfp pilus assembly protein PilN
MRASDRARLDFARRPFSDERPVWALVGLLVAVGAILLFFNVRLYASFHSDVADIRADIQKLGERSRETAKEAGEARTVLQSYKLSSLAGESQSLLKLVAERRFSCTALLNRLEKTLPPDVRLARLAPQFDNPEEVSLSIGLVGRGPDSVVKTIAALASDRAFHDVELKMEASAERGVPEGYSFELVLSYAPDEAAGGKVK